MKVDAAKGDKREEAGVFRDKGGSTIILEKFRNSLILLAKTFEKSRINLYASIYTRDRSLLIRYFRRFYSGDVSFKTMNIEIRKNVLTKHVERDKDAEFQ